VPPAPESIVTGVTTPRRREAPAILGVSMNYELLKSYCTVTEGVNPCWLWNRRKTPQGYAATDREVTMKLLGAKSDTLHNAVAMEHPDYVVGAYSRHGCVNKHCVSPNHVIPGTHAENMQDRVLDGAQNTAKLTPDKVREIREDKSTRKEAAVKYGVSASTIKKIRCGYTWGWLHA
jgi:hypothetical protein